MTKRFLTRSEAAEYLTNVGYPVAKNTLQKFACLGGGPVYLIFGNRALYRPNDLDTWANRKLGTPRISTSDDLIA
ncbi:hypothetical protein GCM10008927_28750 [Amylibacter ulvae]|uniref:DNA-binding protein n=1 Tax=Paramylibacter ulvae TaxID=1651968 RepID=A0ABQ3D792_9RHOB|nr:DNA-binding protein [Amylibacter ulvae]GHA61505.1 hypothetical protein GCM10008927_28750 [Amylibacter ulvae]